MQALLEQRFPFYKCTAAQVQILRDIAALETSAGSTEELLRKSENEFIRLNSDGKKNEQNNRISIVIGITGILVSVLLTILQMLG